MEITIPAAPGTGLQIIEHFSVTHTGRDYFVQWDTNGIYISVNSSHKEGKPDFLVDIRPGRVEVTQIEVDNRGLGRHLAPAVIEATDTKDIENVKFRHLIEKVLTAAIEKRDSASEQQIAETDLSSLL